MVDWLLCFGRLYFFLSESVFSFSSVHYYWRMPCTLHICDPHTSLLVSRVTCCNCREWVQIFWGEALLQAPPLVFPSRRWHKRRFTVEGRRGPVESWFTAILWSSLFSLFNLPTCIHFESWHWNFPVSVSCVSPLSFPTLVAFVILEQLLGPYIVCRPVRWPFLSVQNVSYGFVLKSPFMLSVEPRAPCRVGTTTEVTYCPGLLFSLETGFAQLPRQNRPCSPNRPWGPK